jgi:hypothetical protein
VKTTKENVKTERRKETRNSIKGKEDLERKINKFKENNSIFFVNVIVRLLKDI